MADVLELSVAARPHLERVRVLATDLDGTLTTGVRVEAATLAALERATDAGVRVVVVTGRPSGWADMIARTWPVAAAIAEGGAVSARWHDGRLERVYVTTARDERARHRARLDALGEELLALVPEAALASDQAFRECDLAIDVREERRVSDARIELLLTHARGAGFVADVSSVHVNVWLGDHDKGRALHAVLTGWLGLTVPDLRRETLVVGDSRNDESMFAAFPLSVGVANIRDVLPRLGAAPRFVTRAPGGRGVIEVVDVLLASRRTS